jgi:hypothetical protein
MLPSASPTLAPHPDEAGEKKVPLELIKSSLEEIFPNGMSHVDLFESDERYLRILAGEGSNPEEPLISILSAYRPHTLLTKKYVELGLSAEMAFWIDFMQSPLDDVRAFLNRLLIGTKRPPDATREESLYLKGAIQTAFLEARSIDDVLSHLFPELSPSLLLGPNSFLRHQLVNWESHTGRYFEGEHREFVAGFFHLLAELAPEDWDVVKLDGKSPFQLLHSLAVRLANPKDRDEKVLQEKKEQMEKEEREVRVFMAGWRASLAIPAQSILVGEESVRKKLASALANRFDVDQRIRLELHAHLTRRHPELDHDHIEVITIRAGNEGDLPGLLSQENTWSIVGMIDGELKLVRFPILRS